MLLLAMGKTTEGIEASQPLLGEGGGAQPGLP